MPSTDPSVSLAIEGALATVTIDHPKKYNALCRAIWDRLPVVIGQACAQSATRVIVLRGAGGNFAAGADITEFDELFADRTATLRYLSAMIAATDAIAGTPVPVIAAIEGLCIGAGVAVALACDIRIADTAASFAVTPAKLGLAYSFTDTRRLVAAIGASHAKDLLFTGRRIDAAHALACGLIDAIGDRHAVAAKVAAIAGASPWTHTQTKRMLHAIESGATAETEETRGWFADAIDTADFREGLAAFRDRRPPNF